MKVWQLRKINEAAIDFRFSLDYEKIFEMSNEDIDLIIKKIEEENDNIDSLLGFLEYIQGNPNWKESFAHLEGIENIDLKEYIFETIGKSTSQEDTSAILNYFDFCDEDKLAVFQTVEEWKTYIESINSNIEKIDNLLASNLKIVLKYSEENRCDLIKKVMEYSLSNVSSITDLSEKSIDYEKMPMTFNDVFTLLNEEYEEDSIFSLINLWMEKRKDTSLTTNREIDEKFSDIFAYLKETSIFPKDKTEKLVEILQTCYHSYEYRRILTLLREMENNEDKELLEICLDKQISLHNHSMWHYINLISQEQHNEYNYRDALIYLWRKGTIEKNISDAANMERIIAALTLAKENEQNAMELAEFIEKLPAVEIMKNMNLRGKEKETYQTIYQNFPQLIKEDSLDISQIEYYTNLLTKLSRLPNDICSKIMNIMNLSLVKDLIPEDKNKLQELIFNPENFGSLDYIFEQYRQKDEVYREHIEYVNTVLSKKDINYTSGTIELATVSELLVAGYNFNKVLDGFQDDDEITPKTLIRSYAYKNNQN